MNFPDEQNQELQRREQELKAREREIRLRELEAEIKEPPMHQTMKHQQQERSPQRWYGKLMNVGKFLVIVVAIVVAIRVATAFAYLIMLGAVAWVAYKIFFEGDRSKGDRSKK
ncbi:MAG TPA: hypothetical protein DCE56_18445 [Cyanobacteria bacterium UBA8553]|nr:hypothetical protein [Cyanobacteria bacterium UBA8553]HAJ63270.1 hypothetical protein [Cyanobacteria bacterium UBA8543]